MRAAILPACSCSSSACSRNTSAIASEWICVVVYAVERSPELLRLANEIVEAVQPFAVSGGTADAFVKVSGEQINAETIKYVEASYRPP